MSTLCMVIGPPASGKTRAALKNSDFKNFKRLNRDLMGGTNDMLLVHVVNTLAAGKDVIIDGLFPTVKSREPFLAAASLHKAKSICFWMNTSYEQCQINALHRMWERHRKIFVDTDSLKEVKDDPNMFPIAVIFKYKKQFEKPTKDEGFDTIHKEKWTGELFTKESGYVNRAVFLDFDGTLRESPDNGYGYPTTKEEVKLLSGTEVLKEYQKERYLLLGVSNQSGVGKGIITNEQAADLFIETQHQMGIAFKETCWCVHPSPKCFCYCRKPQSGMGVYLIEKYKLDVNQCIMVGDYTSDKTFAKRLGMEYIDEKEFFSRG